MDRRLFLAASAAFSAVFALAANAARPSISTDVAPGADFSAYKTFAFVQARVPEGADPVAFQRILSDIEAGLNAKGYQKADPGDVSLILSLGAQNKTDIENWGAWGLRTDVWQYTEGKLSVDAFDTKTKQALWHGQASEDINPGKPNNGAIDHTVSKLMEKFPASASAGSGSAAP
jgi:hypothetical protein